MKMMLYKKSHGIWLDQFDKNFISFKKINFFYKLNKNIFIVSLNMEDHICKISY